MIFFCKTARAQHSCIVNEREANECAVLVPNSVGKGQLGKYQDYRKRFYDTSTRSYREKTIKRLW